MFLLCIKNESPRYDTELFFSNSNVCLNTGCVPSNKPFKKTQMKKKLAPFDGNTRSAIKLFGYSFSLLLKTENRGSEPEHTETFFLQETHNY